LSADRITISTPSRGELGAIGPVLAAAFLDDPVWVASGPRRRHHRALSNRATFWGIVRASHRHGARIRIARRSGRVAGATIAFEPGSWPLPDAAFAWELGWVLVAGPLPVLRGLRDDRAMRAAHIERPHLYLWFIGVEPELHGEGVGRALMGELHERSDELDLPTYLETGTPSNVRFYRSLGYEVVGELEMPSGAEMWRMERPPPASAGP
jgi:ribosomal protein S18 acetylase RimI-like enzyme